MYSISIDRPTGLIEIKLSGHFSSEEIAEYVGDYRAAVQKLGCAEGDHLLLMDGSEYTAQSQEVVKVFQEMSSDPRIKSRKLAVVLRIGLARMQAKRVMAVRDNAAIFETRDEARSWLLDA